MRKQIFLRSEEDVRRLMHRSNSRKIQWKTHVHTPTHTIEDAGNKNEVEKLKTTMSNQKP